MSLSSAFLIMFFILLLMFGSTFGFATYSNGEDAKLTSLLKQEAASTGENRLDLALERVAQREIENLKRDGVDLVQVREGQFDPSPQLPPSLAPFADLYDQGILEDLIQNEDGSVRDHRAAYSKLRSVLPNLDMDRYPLHRAVVLSRLSDLKENSPLDKEEISKQFLVDLTADPSLQNENSDSSKVGDLIQPSLLNPGSDPKSDSGKDPFYPIFAHRMYISSSPEPEEAIQITLDAVAKRNDPVVAERLVSHLKEKYPLFESTIRESASVRNIDLSQLISPSADSQVNPDLLQGEDSSSAGGNGDSSQSNQEYPQ